MLKLAKNEKKEELDEKKVKEALAEAEKMQQEDGAFKLNSASKNKKPTSAFMLRRWLAKYQ